MAAGLILPRSDESLITIEGEEEDVGRGEVREAQVPAEAMIDKLHRPPRFRISAPSEIGRFWVWVH